MGRLDQSTNGWHQLRRSDLLVGEDQIPLGSDLRVQSLGVSLGREYNQKHRISAHGSYTSASDEPFRDARDRWFGWLLAYQIDVSENTKWIFLFNYSKNRGYLNGTLVPHFVVSTTYGDLTYSAGWPFLQVQWQPSIPWEALARLTPVGFHTEATFKASEISHLQLRAGWTSRSYLHVQRQNEDHRLLFEEKFYEVAVKTKASEHTTIGFSLGHSFDRSTYEAKTVFMPIGPLTRMGSDVIGGLSLEYTP